MPASRRYISVTNKDLDKYLDDCPNVSAFLQEAALFYLQEKENVFARKSDVQEIEKDVEILNKNYLQIKDTLNKLVDSLFNK